MYLSKSTTAISCGACPRFHQTRGGLWGFGGDGGWDGDDGWNGDFAYDDGGYLDDYAPSVVETTSTAIMPPVTVINPASSDTEISFAVAGQVYTLQAGETKDIDIRSGSVIEFDRGNGGTAQYTLESGIYTFAPTTNGWELYHGRLTSAVPASTTPATESRGELASVLGE